MVLPALPHRLFALALITRNFPSPVAGSTAPAQVLLGLKKRGLGLGKWCGFGGKVEATDASVVAAAAREVREEANISVEEKDLQPRGAIMLGFEGGKEILEVHVFSADKFVGEPSESDEMRPRWYDASVIPYGLMWQDARIWVPHVLAGKTVYGHFHYDKDEDTMLHHNLEVMEPTAHYSGISED